MNRMASCLTLTGMAFVLLGAASAPAAVFPIDDFESGSTAESGVTDVAIPIPGYWGALHLPGA